MVAEYGPVSHGKLFARAGNRLLLAVLVARTVVNAEQRRSTPDLLLAIVWNHHAVRYRRLLWSLWLCLVLLDSQSDGPVAVENGILVGRQMTYPVPQAWQEAVQPHWRPQCDSYPGQAQDKDSAAPQLRVQRAPEPPSSLQPADAVFSVPWPHPISATHPAWMTLHSPSCAISGTASAQGRQPLWLSHGRPLQPCEALLTMRRGLHR
mmetsp:Transcript_73412/g.174927  ORF Transcript_73412/g.174927 Transcript_73412/m.174927 type:complete len:207 (+) Transcript_73412:86-706(+)